MEVSEVRIKLMEDPQDRLKAFCSITFESSFVIRDLKIIMGIKGPFVAMPSRKLMDRCPSCRNKNHLRADYCNQCGASLEGERALKNGDGRAKLYADIAHPINSKCRDLIQAEVLQAFEKEVIASQKEGYVCKYDDYGEESYAQLKHPEESEYVEEPKQIIPDANNESIHRRLDTPVAADDSSLSKTTSTSHKAEKPKQTVQATPQNDDSDDFGSDDFGSDDFGSDDFGTGII